MTVITSGALFGPVVRDLRVRAEMKQADLSAVTRIAASQISCYERSRALPDFDTAARLLRGVGHAVVILPALAAKTQPEREAVITAARAMQTEGRGHQALYAALDRLAAAEGRTGDHFDSPYETIRELHDEIATKEREIKAMRAALINIQLAAREVL